MIDPQGRSPLSPDAGSATNRAITKDEIDYWAASAAVIVLVFVLGVVLGDDSFERFLGSAPPVVVTAILVVIGWFSLRTLAYRGWLPARPLPKTRLHVPALAGMAFAVPAVVVDSWIHFPEDMNTKWPESLLFYPSMALLAEITLHLAPLALLLTALRWNLGRHPNDRRRAAAAAVVVAAIETAFQTVDVLIDSDQRLAFFVAPQLAAFGLCQLAILRRYGFAATYSFRLGYYLIWHIVWGDVRLDLFF